jgi:hypothetical protein
MHPTWWITWAVFVHVGNQHCHVTGGVAMIYLMTSYILKLKINVVIPF